MSRLPPHIVTDDESGIRLDRWFKRHFPTQSHGQLQKMLRTGQIRIGGRRVQASTRIQAGQDVRVPPQVIEPPRAQIAKLASRVSNDLKKMILFEDDDVIALNKPARLAVQGGTGLKENLDDMLKNLAQPGHGKPKLVHRLDRDTSGVILVARNAFAATRLAESFRNRTTQKIYWAVTLGVPKPAQGRIEAPLAKKGELMTIAEDRDDNVKTAITVYHNMETAKGTAAFVALWPKTGRTHQLRVHLSWIGTPILGDRLYGGLCETAFPSNALGQGLHLHARRLIIPHPRRGIIDIVAPLGAELRKTWRWFGFDERLDADFSDT
jgi:23S rRNA pseudouridine955/2504/2580 synthase